MCSVEKKNPRKFPFWYFFRYFIWGFSWWSLWNTPRSSYWNSFIILSKGFPQKFLRKIFLRLKEFFFQYFFSVLSWISCRFVQVIITRIIPSEIPTRFSFTIRSWVLFGISPGIPSIFLRNFFMILSFRDSSRHSFRGSSMSSFRDSSTSSFQDSSRYAFRDPSRSSFLFPLGVFFSRLSQTLHCLHGFFRNSSHDSSRSPEFL